MARKLKIFRTSIGFHDAYVAAPSRKAALEAWGSDHDLFASGAAEEVTDPALTRDPLERPGTVIKRVRGSTDEHLAALGKAKPKARLASKTTSTVSAPPRPSRAALERAEAAVERAEGARDTELDEITRQIDALTQARRAADNKHRKAIDRLQRAAEEKRSDYDERLDRWREAQ